MVDSKSKTHNNRVSPLAAFRLCQKKNIVAELSFIFLVGLIVLFWFEDDYYLKSLDSLFGLNPSNRAFEKSYVWNDSSGLGSPNSGINTALLYYFQAVLVDLVGLINSQKVVLYLLFTSSILSFWIFSYYFLSAKRDPTSIFSRIAPSVFYAANPFTMSFIWWHYMLLIFFWISFPLILLLIFRIARCENLKHFLRYSLLLSLLFVIFAPGLSLLTISILIFASIILLAGMRYLQHIRIRIRYLLMASASVFLINAWYVIPYLVTINEELNLAQERVDASSEAQFQVQSKYSSLQNTFRLLGFHILYQKHFEDYYYDWSTFYLNNPFMVAISILIPAFSLISAVIALVGKAKKDTGRRVLVFGLLLLIAIFLQKQGAPPLGEINQSLLGLPFGDVFRHAYDKFAILTVFAYSVLLHSSINIVFPVIKKNLFRILALTFMAILLFTYSYPIWTGEVTFSGGKTIPSHKVVIPDEYYEFGKFMNDITEDQTFTRVAVLPTTFWGEAAYNWEKGVQPNSDPLINDFLNPKFSIVQFRVSSPYGNHLIDRLQGSFTPYNENMAEYVGALASIGTRYLVFHRDWDDNFIRYLPPTKYYENMVNGYSYIGNLQTLPIWDFDGNRILTINKVPLDGGHVEIETLIVATNTTRNQAILNVSGLYIYLTDNNGIYVNFYTQDGYRWTTPIKADFVKSEVPLKAKFVYDIDSKEVYFELNDVRYDTQLNASLPLSDRSPSSPITFSGDIRLGGDGSKNFYGEIYYVKIAGAESFEFLPNKANGGDGIYSSATNELKDAIPIKKIFSNNKLTVYEILGSSDIISVDTSSALIKSKKRVNPSEWNLNVETTGPFVLSFSQSYHQNWQARILKNNSQVDLVNAIPNNGIISKFLIEQTGDLDIIVKYEPQSWFEISVMISVVSLTSQLVIMNRGNLRRLFMKSHSDLQD